MLAMARVSCVTVVDAFAFMDNLKSIERAADRAEREEADKHSKDATTDGHQHEDKKGSSSSIDDEKTVADLMAEQVRGSHDGR